MWGAQMNGVLLDSWGCLRIGTSIFGLTPRCFLLPEQPEVFPEQGSACLEQSEDSAGVILEQFESIF